jgi:hypothetical protein
MSFASQDCMPPLQMPLPGMAGGIPSKHACIIPCVQGPPPELLELAPVVVVELEVVVLPEPPDPPDPPAAPSL